jgi:exodeoxyribonuclease V beta subunit
VRAPAALAGIFRRHGGIWADYAEHIHDLVLPGGFFTGIIDLVFAVDGRFEILDWKSNDLTRRGGYHAQAMAAEMLHHHYVLQYHLYAVALHRYLRLRLADYDPARQLGGVHYVFTRGVDGSGAGWYYARPEPAMVLALDACFGERGDG